jgi:hypothetical protein
MRWLLLSGAMIALVVIWSYWYTLAASRKFIPTPFADPLPQAVRPPPRQLFEANKHCLPDSDPPHLSSNTIVPARPNPTAVSWIHISDALFNPLRPQDNPTQSHHPILTKFFRQYYGPIERDWMTDWAGVHTYFLHECSKRQLYPYVPFVISRRLQCLAHCHLLESQVPCAAGELPVLDDEYPQWIDMLASVVRTPESAHYVMVELGARIGTWGVRALAARRLLHGPNALSTFVAVESYPKYVSWMHHHLAANEMTQQTIVLEANVGRRRETSSLTLAKLFEVARIAHIDYLDLDVQGAEETFLRENAILRDLLHTNVTHIHIGTHSAQVHKALRDFFSVKMGWRMVLDLPHFGTSCDDGLRDALQTRKECWVSTNLGVINVRDGILAFVNPKRAPLDADKFYDPLILVT